MESKQNGSCIKAFDLSLGGASFKFNHITNYCAVFKAFVSPSMKCRQYLKSSRECLFLISASEQTYHPVWCKNSKENLVRNIPCYCKTRCSSLLSIESPTKSVANSTHKFEDYNKFLYYSLWDVILCSLLVGETCWLHLDSSISS